MNNEQRGVALLIVLMLLALMAALAADMTLSFYSQLQRTRQVNHHLQRQYDIELAEKLALASLTQDVKDNDRQTTLQQYWAQPQQLQLEDGNTVKWQLRDAQHCFNLNALAKISDDPLASPDFPAQVFSALLINAGIDRGNAVRSCNQSLTILMSMTHHAFTAQKIAFTKARRRPGIVPIRCFF